MANKEEGKKLKQSLDEFLTSWRNLSRDWEIYGNDLEGGVYPFDESFDDINIDEWVEDMKKEIDRRENVTNVFKAELIKDGEIVNSLQEETTLEWNEWRFKVALDKLKPKGEEIKWYKNNVLVLS